MFHFQRIAQANTLKQFRREVRNAGQPGRHLLAGDGLPTEILIKQRRQRGHTDAGGCHLEKVPASE